MHKLQAVIKKELDEIPEGFNGVVLQGHTVINIIDKLPPEFDYLRISAHVEYGSGKKNTGMSYILSDINGKPFNIYAVKTNGDGKFSTVWADITRKFITINVNRKGKDIIATIYECEVIKPKDFEPECLGFTTKLIWNYSGNEEFTILPLTLRKYQNVLDAAIEKSKCYHCQCTHFYEKKD